MIALDTNVLLRYVVDDGSPEARLARDRLPALVIRTPAFFVSLVALSEATWVLRSRFKYRRKEIAAFVQHLLEDSVFQVEALKVARAALSAYKEGRYDYSDAVIVESARNAGCVRTLTFDRTLRGLKDVEVWMATAN